MACFMQIMITASLLAWFLVFKLQPDLRRTYRCAQILCTQTHFNKKTFLSLRYLIFFQNSSTLDIPVTPGESSYAQPSSESSSEVSFDDIDTEHALSKPVEALNTYLVSRDLSPIRPQLTIPWETAGERTKRYYIRKDGQGVTAVVVSSQLLVQTHGTIRPKIVSFIQLI